jgi:hypothetical protein
VLVRGVRLVDVHHHDPLEVGHGANYGVQTVIVGERTAVFGDVGELAPRALARPPGLLTLGPLCPELVTRQPPQSAMRIVPSLADYPERRLTLRQAD